MQVGEPHRAEIIQSARGISNAQLKRILNPTEQKVLELVLNRMDLIDVEHHRIILSGLAEKIENAKILEEKPTTLAGKIGEAIDRNTGLRAKIREEQKKIDKQGPQKTIKNISAPIIKVPTKTAEEQKTIQKQVDDKALTALLNEIGDKSKPTTSVSKEKLADEALQFLSDLTKPQETKKTSKVAISEFPKKEELKAVHIDPEKIVETIKKTIDQQKIQIMSDLIKKEKDPKIPKKAYLERIFDLGKSQPENMESALKALQSAIGGGTLSLTDKQLAHSLYQKLASGLSLEKEKPQAPIEQAKDQKPPQAKTNL